MTYAPEFGELLACRWAGYRWHEWKKLSGNTKAMYVAAYDQHARMAALQEMDAAKK